jgi:hypothetical protein
MRTPAAWLDEAPASVEEEGLMDPGIVIRNEARADETAIADHR